MIKLRILFFLLFFLCVNNLDALAFDLSDGAWKNLNEKYHQSSENKKMLSGIFSNKIYYNDIYNSNVEKNQNKDIYLDTKLGLNVKLSEGLSIKTLLQLNKVSKTNSSQDNYFQKEGIFAQELVLNYNYQNLSFLAGKFNQNFGNAWRSSNGIWVNKVSKEYSQLEKLGIGTIARFGDRKTYGEYVFGFSTFTNDRKNLDNSLITERNSDTKQSGKPGDTRSLESYLASMDVYYNFGKKFGQQEDLSYHFAYSNLAVNERHGQIADQKGFVFSIKYLYPVAEKLLISSLVEYVKIHNFDGDDENNANFLTTNLTAHYHDFHLTLTRGNRREISSSSKGTDASINEISVGYKFDNLIPVLKGLVWSIGYNQSKTNPVNNQAFGSLLSHKTEF